VKRKVTSGDVLDSDQTLHGYYYLEEKGNKRYCSMIKWKEVLVKNNEETDI